MKHILFVIGMIALVGLADAPQTRSDIPGVGNFAKIDATAAIAGATTAAGVADVKKLGYRTIINLRQPTEAGADIDAEEAAATQAGLRFLRFPMSGTSPDPSAVGRAVQAAADPGNAPVLIHCGSGNRAAMVWMIKRIVVDGWDADRASAEAAAGGLTIPALKMFGLEYAAAHKK